MVQVNPALDAKKNIPVPFHGIFFTEISVQMVSALGLIVFLLFEIHYHALPYPKTKENNF